MKSVGSLPLAPELEQLYKRWQLLYREFYRERGAPSTRAISIESAGVTHFSEVEFSELSQQLKIQLNAWLNSESFHPIDRKLSRVLDPADEIRVIFETNNDLLRRLPWDLWNFFEDYPKAEMALSVQEYGQVKPQSETAVGSVRILAILGNSTGIDVQADRNLLETLEGAEPIFLEEPTHQILDEHLWDPQGWDILFFAGHSQTEQDTGRIYINQTDSLTLDQLRNALKQAISRGLKLAILNSCDGLGLAQSLADLQIPQVIIMREVVPDVIAQEFFRHFITAFSGGQSLHASVRTARERLERLEADYPCATWLPVICQNPAEEPATWQALRRPSPKNRPLSRLQQLQTVLTASVMATALVLGVRQVGVLQQWELQAFDHLMRIRPAEKPDPRLTIVSITESDVQNQDPTERRGSSLSDQTLTQLLDKLQTYQPRVIGLDIYRDFPIDPDQSALAAQVQENASLITICEVGETSEQSGTRPLPNIPAERLSFSDLPVDTDGVIRRQLLGMAPNPKSFCTTDTSFSLRAAQHYLAAEDLFFERNPDGVLQVGSAKFKQLAPHTGGYQQLDARGYQVLLNYRASGVAATQITLADLLNDSIDANLLRDRVILIGTTAKSFKDYLPTPYTGAQGAEEMAGVMIHAHMVSQILSAVLDQRPLLWWLSPWKTTAWIWGWSLVGGGLVLICRSPLQLGLASGAAGIILYGACFGLLLKGGWMPLAPSALALVGSGAGVVAYTVYQKKLQASTPGLRLQ